MTNSLDGVKKGVMRDFRQVVRISKGMEFRSHVKRVIDRRDVLLECVRQFGSPLYVLDEAMLKERAVSILGVFRQRLERVGVFYAFKSNDLPYLIKRLRELGIGADVASLFELELALRLGFKRIIYTAPYKNDKEIMVAIRNSGRVVLNIDNMDELERVIKAADRIDARNVRVSFRLRPVSHPKAWLKFGFVLEEFREAAKRASECSRIRWVGVHFHSSWNRDPTAYIKNIRAIGKYLKENFKQDELASLEFFDIGGGFIPDGQGTLFSATEKGHLVEKYVTDEKKRQVLNEPILETFTGIERFSLEISKAIKKEIMEGIGRKDIEIWLEPGRYLSSLSSFILLKVVSVRGERVYVDGGINLVGCDSFNYEYFPVVNLTRPSVKRKKGIIYGPLCDPDDHWGYSYYGEKCRVGDILAVVNQGSYTFSSAWRWQRPIAAYVSFNGNKITLAKKEEGFNDRYAGCRF